MALAGLVYRRKTPSEGNTKVEKLDTRIKNNNGSAVQKMKIERSRGGRSMISMQRQFWQKTEQTLDIPF